jgi:hypothetical protein
VSVYIIREENVYVVHIMKNILLIIGIFYSGSWKKRSLRPLFTPFIMFAPTTTPKKILLSVRNFPNFVFKITTFHLFKKYYNTHLQSKTFYVLDICSLFVMKITKRNKFKVLPYNSLTFWNTILDHSLFTSPYLESWHDANLYALMIKLTLKGC